MAVFKSKYTKKNAVTLIFVTALYAVVAFMLYSGNISRQMQNMLLPISVYVVLAVSLNLVVGLLGELSLGHAGFMSVGLFSGCLVSIALVDKLPEIARLPIAMIVGGLVAAIFGFIVGLPALRLKGDYLAIVTLACCEIIKSAITNLEITGGALGLNTSKVYSNAKSLLPYAFALVFLTCLVTMNLKTSQQGRAIMAIRDNRIAAESIGINVTYFKLAVFVLAAFFAGAAGVLYGHCFANIKAASFDYNMSIEVLVIVVLGGMGSIRGTVIAAIVLRALPELLREFSDYRMLVYAIVLILVMLAKNNPTAKQFFDKIGSKVQRFAFKINPFRKRKNVEQVEAENEARLAKKEEK